MRGDGSVSWTKHESLSCGTYGPCERDVLFVGKLTEANFGNPFASLRDSKKGLKSWRQRQYMVPI